MTAGPAEDDDRALLARWRSGEEAAFAALVHRYASLVHGTCRRVLGDAGLADDAAQAVFLVLARRVDALGHEASLAGWLHGTARRCAQGVLRERRRRERRERAAAREAVMTDHDPIEAAVRERLDAALGALPAGQRAVVVERILCGRSEEETGRRLGLSRSAVSVRLARALEALRARLARGGPTLPAAALASLLAAEAMRPASAATLACADPGAPVSPLARAVADHAMHLPAMTIVLPLVFAVAVAVAIAGAVAGDGGARVPDDAAPPAAVAADAPPPAPVAPVAPRLLDRDGRVAAWSPDGSALAWIAARDERAVEPVLDGGGRRPVAGRCVLVLADADGGGRREVELLRDAPAAHGLAWLDAGTVLAWSERRLWRIDAAGTRIVDATEPAGAPIGSVLPSPDARRWVVAWTRPDGRPAFAVQQPGHLDIHDGEHPCWSRDGRTLFFADGDGVWALSGAEPAPRRLFTAASYATHPFAGTVAPPPGARHAVWPLAELADGALLVEVVEVSPTRGGFGPAAPRAAWRGELVLWRRDVAIVNGRRDDLFHGIGETLADPARGSVRWLPLDDAGTLLRLEQTADPWTRLGRSSIGFRLERLVAMTVSTDDRAILRLHDLPHSIPLTRVATLPDGSPRRTTGHRTLRYTCHGRTGDGALFAIAADGVPEDAQQPPCTGLLWLGHDGGRRWLMLPRAGAASRTIVDAAVAADGRAVIATRARTATGEEQGLYLADPKQAVRDLPLMAGVTITIAGSGRPATTAPPAGF